MPMCVQYVDSRMGEISGVPESKKRIEENENRTLAHDTYETLEVNVKISLQSSDYSITSIARFSTQDFVKSRGSVSSDCVKSAVELFVYVELKQFSAWITVGG